MTYNREKLLEKWSKFYETEANQNKLDEDAAKKAIDNIITSLPCVGEDYARALEDAIWGLAPHEFCEELERGTEDEMGEMECVPIDDDDDDCLGFVTKQLIVYDAEAGDCDYVYIACYILTEEQKQMIDAKKAG